MTASHEDDARSRVVDASLNRAAEALRVVEDICRFAWDLPGISGELKEVRHAVLHAFAPSAADRMGLTASRDIEGDVGRGRGVALPGAGDLTASAVRNLERAKEALRTLEEIARIRGGEEAPAAAALRYRLYSIEKGIAHLRGRGPGGMAGVRLYLIASASVLRGASLLEGVEAALAGGAGAVQLREKELPGRRLVELGRSLREITARAGALLIVNDRPDVAAAIGADGVHLGQDDLPVPAARRILGPGPVIGVSTRSAGEARKAVREGADHLGLGPVFATTTKDAGSPIGIEAVREALGAVDVPIFPIGGIHGDNAADLAAAGVRRAAVSSGILGTGGPGEIEEAARTILKRLEG